MVTFVDPIQLAIQVEMKQHYIFRSDVSIALIVVRLCLSMIRY
jgi:hypothetical protein